MEYVYRDTRQKTLYCFFFFQPHLKILKIASLYLKSLFNFFFRLKCKESILWSKLNGLIAFPTPFPIPINKIIIQISFVLIEM